MSVWQKLRTFRKNAGLFGSATLTTVAVIFTVGGVTAVLSGQYIDSMLIFWPIVCLTWPLRWRLFLLFHKLGRGSRYFGALLVIATIMRPTGGWFPGDDWILFSLFATYYGFGLWLLSESIEIDLRAI